MPHARLVLFSSLIAATSLTLSGCTGSLMSSNSATPTGPAPAMVAVGEQVNGVAPNRWQYVQFNEAMDPSTIDNRTFVVADSSGKPVAGTVVYNDGFQVAGFKPTPPLQQNANYTVTVSTDVANMQGVHLAAAYTYNITTRDSTDSSPLYVANVLPAPNATCVSATTPISITFSEGADISTVNSANIVITGPSGSAISAQINYDVATATAKLTPLAPLSSGSFTVTVKNVADAAGVPMTSVYSWGFQTACPGGGGAQNFSVLYSFKGGTGDGGNPEVAPVMDHLGNLYGTTEVGGSAGKGTVYKLDKTGNESILHSFTGGDDGVGPYQGSVLLIDASGNIYGTTTSGGSSNLGTVFKIGASGNETVLHSFSGAPSDGAYPHCSLLMDSAGNLYGTTSNGGSSNRGTVFKIDTSMNLTILHNFTGFPDDGQVPAAGLVRDAAGNFYGTTGNGGSSGNGTVFKIDSSGNESVLYSFKGGSDGSEPLNGALAMDAAGNLYGSTLDGGPSLGGVVFKVTPSGSETVLRAFNYADGATLLTGVVIDSAGNLYGTAASGGGSVEGAVFKLDPSGNETILHTFNFADGAHPEAGLFMDSVGNLYGTTRDGGSSGNGVVFKVTP